MWSALGLATRPTDDMRASPASRGARPTPAAPGTAPPPGRPPPAEPRWQGRPVLAGALRTVVFAVPLLASLGSAWMMSQALGTPHGLAQHLLWWAAVLSSSLGALVVFDHLVRRLLPLAGLLRLSLIFPDRAPSRLGVALRSGSTKRLQAREVEALQRGDLEPAEAAHTILALAASLNVHDRNTRGHSERVRAYADLIGAELGLGEADRDRLRWAALLHDLGKLTVSPSTLNAHHDLDPDDWESLRRHPLEGARLAEPLRAWLGPWSLAIEQHHERFDGTGYPFGLAGQEISLGARIVAVADSYDAMTSVRSYSSGMSAAAARKELARQAGSHFDPVVVRAFLNVALGRVRWAMGPFALLGAVPFAPALGGVRRAAETAGRTAAMGTASVVAAATVLQPPAVVTTPAGHQRRPAREAPAQQVAAAPAVTPAPGIAPPPQEPPTQTSAPVQAAAPIAAPVAVDVAAVQPPAVTEPPPIQPPVVQPPAVPASAAAEPPPPATEPAPVPCRDNGTAENTARPCQPPRWGHTEEGNTTAATRP